MNSLSQGNSSSDWCFSTCLFRLAESCGTDHPGLRVLHGAPHFRTQVIFRKRKVSVSKTILIAAVCKAIQNHGKFKPPGFRWPLAFLQSVSLYRSGSGQSQAVCCRSSKSHLISISCGYVVPAGCPCGKAWIHYGPERSPGYSGRPAHSFVGRECFRLEPRIHNDSGEGRCASVGSHPRTIWHQLRTTAISGFLCAKGIA